MEFKAIKFMEEAEGRKPHMYQDSGGKPTIGIGHLLTQSELSSGKILINGSVVRYHGGLTDEQIDALLRQDLAVANRAVDRMITVPLTQNQHDALVSFVFNIGVGAFQRSTLRAMLNAGQYDAVPAQMRRWNKGGGKVCKGLINRREDEVELWDTLDGEMK